jgi:hypothetical protein
MRSLLLWAAPALALLSACPGRKGPTVPEPEAEAPAPPSVCTITDEPRAPLVTSWASSDTAWLEAAVTSGKGVPVMSVRDGRIEMLQGCKLSGPPFTYRQTNFTEQRCDVNSANQGKGGVPLSSVDVTLAASSSGRYSLLTGVRGVFLPEEGTVGTLSGKGCGAATHYVTSLSVGAHALVFAKKRSVGGELKVPSIVEISGSSERDVEVGKRAGNPKACLTDSTTPISECSAAVSMGLAPLPGDCTAVVSSELTLDGSSPTHIGSCKIPADKIGRTANVIISGDVMAKCDHPDIGWCNSPPEWTFDVLIDGQPMTVTKKGANNPAKPRVHGYHFETQVGTVNGITAQPDIKLQGRACFVASSTDKTCYVASGFNVVLVIP